MMITSRNTSLPFFMRRQRFSLSLFLPLFFCDVSRPRRRRRSTFDNVCERSTLFPTLFLLTATFFYRLWWGNPRRPPLFRLLLLLPSVSPSDRSLLSSFSSSVPPSLHSPQLFPPSPLLKYMHLQKSSPALLMRRRGGNNSEHFFNRPENFQTIPLGGFRGQGGERKEEIYCVLSAAAAVYV